MADKARAANLKGVQRPAAAAGVDARVVDGQARAVEPAAQAGEEVGLVGHVHEHLQAVTAGRGAGGDDGAIAGGCFARQQALRVPGQFVGAAAGVFFAAFGAA